MVAACVHAGWSLLNSMILRVARTELTFERRGKSSTQKYVYSQGQNTTFTYIHINRLVPGLSSEESHQFPRKSTTLKAWMMTVTVNDHQISKKSAQNPIFAPLDGSTMNQSFKSLNIPQSTDRHFFARTQRTAPKIDTICITNVSQYVCRIGVIQNGESIIFSPLTPQE